MLEARFRHTGGNASKPPFICLASFDYAYSMLVCLKLSTLSLPGWDLRLVRDEVDFDRYLLLQIQELREFTARRKQNYELGNDGDSTEAGDGMVSFEDPFVRLCNKLSQLRACVVPELAATMPGPDAPARPQSSAKDVQSVAAANGTAHQDASMNAAHGGAEHLGDAFPGDSVEVFDDFNFWQELYGVNERETNFSSLLAWGSDDMSDPYEHWTTMGFES